MKRTLIGINPCISLNNGKYLLLDLLNQEINLLDENELKKFKKIPDFKNKKNNTGKIILSTTYNCNLNCKYCYVRGGDLPVKMLEYKSAIKAIDFLLSKNLDELTIQFFGGEPTLNIECIQKVVEYLKKHKHKTKINYELSTNGLINDKLAKYFVKNKFLFIISLDGPKEIHNYHRPARSKSIDSFKKTLSTIRLILKNNGALKIRTTVTSHSVNQMSDIVKCFSTLGIELIHFEVFVPLGRGEDRADFKPNKEDYVKNFIKAYLVAKDLNIQITQFGLFDLFSPSKYTCASTHKYKFVIMPDGEILYCLGAQEEFGDFINEFKLGYCTEEKLYIDQKKAESLPTKYNVDLIEKCDDCFIKYICKGVCPALNAVSNGEWDIPDEYSCYIRQEIIEDLIIDIGKTSFGENI
ncbi:radical SAM protein [Patescibacteria group bacterium]|nr:radical SAM protein [Patescibacteria group bacterium]